MDGEKISITGNKPGITSFEDFDVFSGKDGLSRDEYKASTFRNGSQDDSDPQFEKMSDLMESTGGTEHGEEKVGRTATETEEESKLEP
jgi:hypothetical protein